MADAFRLLDRTPPGRPGEACEVGYAVISRCSPAGRFVPGVLLPGDGGAGISFQSAACKGSPMPGRRRWRAWRAS